MEVKYVVNDVKTGKSYQKGFENVFIGKKISDKVTGEEIGLSDYELEITGGSDSSGFPMFSGLPTSGRKKILLGKGFAAKEIEAKGIKLRKTVRGNTVSDQAAQINLKVIKYGKIPIAEAWNIQEKPKEEKVEEKK